MGFKGPKRTCDVCGLTFYEETEMTIQDGIWVCIVGPRCFDEKDHDNKEDY